MTTSHLAALRTIGFPAEERGIWASVGAPGRDFGWKLHLSSVQGEAGGLLERIAPLLRARSAIFKVAATDEILGELNEGTFGVTQIGKFATLYPRDDADCVELAEQLLALTQGLCGPRIIADLALGNILHARYGPFRRCAPDDRSGHPASAAAPAVDIFADWPVTRDHPATAGRLIGPGFLPTGQLTPSVSLAMDLREPGPRAIVVLKRGGCDMRDRLYRQQALGQALAGRARVPNPRALFAEGDRLFLALDYIEGRDFSERGAAAFCARDEAGQRGLLGDFIAAVDTLQALHAAGIVHRDLSPGNVRAGIDGKVWLLDLHRAQSVGGAAAFSDDIHGLGCLLANALTGLDIGRMSLAGDGALPERLAAFSGAPAALIEICARMLGAAPERRPGLDEIRAALMSARLAVAGRIGGGARLPFDPPPLQPDAGLILAPRNPASHRGTAIWAMPSGPGERCCL